MLIVVIFSLYGCYKDKGNYDYNNINEIIFDSIKIEPSASVQVGEAVNMHAYITNTISENENDLKFEWYLSGNGDSTLNLVASGKDVENVVFDLNAGTYYFFLKVTDTKTGVSFYSNRIEFKYNNDISTGFLIMSDVNGETSLNFLNNKAGEFVLRSIKPGGIPALGAPICVACFDDANGYGGNPQGLNKYTVAIITETGAYGLLYSNLSYSTNYNLDKPSSILGKKPDNFAVKELVMPIFVNRNNRTSGAALLRDQDGNFMWYQVGPAQSYKWAYNTFVNRLNDTVFKVSDKVAFFAYGSQASANVYFNEDKKSFVKQPLVGPVCSRYTTGQETLFPFNNTGYNLIWMGGKRVIASETEGTVFAVVEKNNTYNLLRFLSNGEQKEITDITALPEIKNVKNFILNSENDLARNAFLYYATDTEIYVYNISDKSIHKVFTAPTGQKITFTKNQMLSDWGYDHIWVATYDPSAPADKCGTFEVYKMEEVTGNLTLATRRNNKDEIKNLRWEKEFGKIVSVSVKMR